jgi:hypothetical protein
MGALQKMNTRWVYLHAYTLGNAYNLKKCKNPSHAQSAMENVTKILKRLV